MEAIADYTRCRQRTLKYCETDFMAMCSQALWSILIFIMQIVLIICFCLRFVAD